MKSHSLLRSLAVLGLSALIVFGTAGCICMLPHLFGHRSDTHFSKAGPGTGTNHVPHVHEPIPSN
ncbi:MAG: hypothetical protein A2498_03620 [Lentisphaerae bacterium RIFOXYC12_FULL_60_16]|nr:MAG: hypothetical protein A2498_03620 [Lentisphaerae bacterium RIFOXYC12_FULL_60_16]